MIRRIRSRSANLIAALLLAAIFSQGAKADADFDRLFPYYTMECSIGQIHRKGHFFSSDLGGHALVFIKGACRDKSFRYPKLKLCDPGTDLTNPNAGVTVSTEKIIKNSQFIASDGQDFLFNGTLAPGATVTEDAIEQTKAAIVESGALDGVELHDKFMKKLKPGQSVPEYVAEKTVFRSFAISLGQDATCVRIPMTRSQIEAEVSYVNETNEPFVSGKKEFHWTLLSNSCVDFTHNILAAAGIRSHFSVGSSILRQIFNVLTLHVQVPKNETLSTEEAVNDLSKLGTAEGIYNDPRSREEFLKFGTLPETGSVFQMLPIRGDNEVCQKPPGGIFLDVPLLDLRGRKLEKLSNDPSYNSVAGSLTRLRDRFLELQSERTPIVENDTSELAEFSRRYNAWVDQMVKDLDAKLALARSGS